MSIGMSVLLLNYNKQWYAEEEASRVSRFLRLRHRRVIVLCDNKAYRVEVGQCVNKLSTQDKNYITQYERPKIFANVLLLMKPYDLRCRTIINRHKKRADK